MKLILIQSCRPLGPGPGPAPSVPSPPACRPAPRLTYPFIINRHASSSACQESPRARSRLRHTVGVTVTSEPRSPRHGHRVSATGPPAGLGLTVTMIRYSAIDHRRRIHCQWPAARQLEVTVTATSTTAGRGVTCRPGRPALAAPRRPLNSGRLRLRRPAGGFNCGCILLSLFRKQHEISLG